MARETISNGKLCPRIFKIKNKKSLVNYIYFALLVVARRKTGSRQKKARKKITNAGENKQLRKINLRGKLYQMRIQLFNIVESTSTISLIL
jgi:hypothetical protein